MEDSFHSPNSRKNSKVASVITSQKLSKSCLVSSTTKFLSQRCLRFLALFHHGKIGRGATDATLFLLKVAALEIVRRLSRTRCPFVWSGIQVLQIICYPPFRWIQRWAPFKGLVKGMQIVSRPLLVLSIATAFSDESRCDNVTSHDTEDPNNLNDSHAFSESLPELSSTPSTIDAEVLDEAPQCLASKTWLLQLYAELKNQGIVLPERINEDELHIFYSAANGDFSCLLSSVKKTIHWRENYNILSAHELNRWSDMVFWHGSDVKHRPCLIIRLGLACVALPSHDRPRFAQAIVSQVEHGVLHLVDRNDPQITVVVDCEGLSPFKFPMQMMRSCCNLLQDHYPNRLGCLFVIRLPPVVHVIAQTFIQVLKPVTQQKLKIEGQMYQKVLSEYLQTLPSYLGTTCRCMGCSNIGNSEMRQPHIDEDTNNTQNNDEDLSSPLMDINISYNGDRMLRIAISGILIFWVMVVFIFVTFEQERHPDLQP